MITTSIIIINKLGLHARASAKLVALAAKYQSRFDIIKNNKKVNGKSIMAVMMLAASQGTKLEFEVEGPDEEAMTEALVKLINDRFGEAE